MKKVILSLVLSMCAFSLTAIAAEGQADKSKGECVKKEACDKAKKEGGCCKEKQGQAGKKNSSDQAKK